MDTTALTTAWLDAVYRARSAAYQNYVEQVPQAKAPRTDRTLSDTILSALQDDGVKPQQAIDPVQAAADTQGADTQGTPDQTSDQTSNRTSDQHVDLVA
jgi:hypothetical protein